MADVDCRRCGQRKPGLGQAPLPGVWGQAVLAETCANCWQAWSEEQTRLINHLGLKPYITADKQVLYQRLHEYLNLSGVASPEG